MRCGAWGPRRPREHSGRPRAGPAWRSASGSSPSGTGSPSRLAGAHRAGRAGADVELAVAAEELGIDGAYVRVHHFARQLASPFPLLAAIGARTSRIEIGTGVIDMRYENPLYMAEEAAAADLISGGRLQLGVSRGSPETALRGSEAFGYVPPEGRPTPTSPGDKTALFRAAICGAGVVRRRPADDRRRRRPAGRSSRSPPASPTASGGAPARGRPPMWTAEQGMNLMSSTLLTEDTGVPFDELQAEQIALLPRRLGRGGLGARAARLGEPQRDADHDRPGPRVLRRRRGRASDQVGILDGGRARFGKSYVGEPDVIAEELAKDAAVREADTVLLTVPNQLGVDYNARLLENIAGTSRPRSGGCTRTSAPPDRLLWGWSSRFRSSAEPRRREEHARCGHSRRSKPRSSAGAEWVSAPTAR